VREAGQAACNLAVAGAFSVGTATQTNETTMPMRTVLAIVAALSISVVALPLGAAAQQAAPSAPKVAAPAATPSAQPPKTAVKRVARKKKMASHRVRRNRDTVCSIMNGWRAFPTRNPRGYFDTGRRPCLAMARVH
jgi:hypothetical protein